MSWYYNYTLGFRKDGKIYPFGPFNHKGEIVDIVSKSRSFASDLHESFHPVPEEEVSEELKEKFSYTDYDNEKRMSSLYYCDLKDLPEGDGTPIRKGYFLISDVEEYENDPYMEDELFYDCLTPTVYAAKAANETRFGIPKPQKDAEGNEFEVHSASDYMYYAYERRNCLEEEVKKIRFTAQFLKDSLPFSEDPEIVVLMTQG